MLVCPRNMTKIGRFGLKRSLKTATRHPIIDNRPTEPILYLENILKSAKGAISTVLLEGLHTCSPCGLARVSERARFTGIDQNGRPARASVAVGALSPFPSRRG